VRLLEIWVKLSNSDADTHDWVVGAGFLDPLRAAITGADPLLTVTVIQLVAEVRASCMPALRMDGWGWGGKRESWGACVFVLGWREGKRESWGACVFVLGWRGGRESHGEHVCLC